jgi:hypothetical protein
MSGFPARAEQSESWLASRLVVRTVLALAGLVIGYVCWQSFLSARAEARFAIQSTEEMQSLARDIRKSRAQPQFAVTKVDSATALTDRIIRSSQIARLSKDAIRSITPQPSSRIGNTAYGNRNTEIELQSVTLEQAIRFAEQLRIDEAASTIENLRFFNPDKNRWQVQMVLVQRFFMPGISN